MTARKASTPEDETRGLAFASYTLMKALLDVLEKKAVLTGQEVQDVLDQTLNALEHRVQDPAIDIARRLIEGAVIARSAARREGSSD
jgi:hypothetical protein